MKIWTMKQTLENTRHCAVAEGRSAARSMDAYVRENVWSVMGAAAGIGFLLAAVLGLKRRF